jgi:fibro-slime domain-containing protein
VYDSSLLNPYVETKFDPLNGAGFVGAGLEPSYCGNSSGSNLSFTSETHFWFEYQGGEQFAFNGDDDVWVFLNGRLMIDLGDLHHPQAGSFSLDSSGVVTATSALGGTTTINLGLRLGGIYEVSMFHAERQYCGSNFKITIRNFTKPRTVCHPVCGNGIVTAFEQCDEGAANSDTTYGGCTTQCTWGPFCGDGIPQSNWGEQCDDGVNMTVYGSSAGGCAPGCVLPHYCGDQRLDAAFGEECDNGTANSASAYGPGACTTTCHLGPYCGDGLWQKEMGEQCDDGPNNGTVGSQCDTSCRIKCGNGVVDAGEQCDFGPDAQGGTKNTGAYNGCRSNCTWGPYCGDGVRDAAGDEQCDDGKNDGSYGTCTSNCQLAPYCGDGRLDTSGGELCDQGSANAVDAYGLGRCTTRCRPAPFCGDNAVNTEFGEKCDDGANNSDSRPGACKLDCSGYIPPPPTCGNGTVDAGEQCDDGANNGASTSRCDVRCKWKCGNGMKDPGEECDDGINDGSYGTCRSDCTLGPYCGDGLTNGPEQCDLGAGNQGDPYGPGTCTLQCTTGPYCGDGRLQAAEGEECDGQSGCGLGCRWVISQ